MFLSDLKQQATTNSPEEFLALLTQAGIQDINDYLLFNLDNEMTAPFFSSLSFLENETTWTEKELSQAFLVAQTIDSDSLFYLDNRMIVIPVSLNKQDSEIHELNIWDFFIQFESGTLATNILAIN